MTSYELREHKVKHTSKIPANYGDEVELPVREYDGHSRARPRAGPDAARQERAGAPGLRPRTGARQRPRTGTAGHRNWRAGLRRLHHGPPGLRAVPPPEAMDDPVQRQPRPAGPPDDQPRTGACDSARPRTPTSWATPRANGQSWPRSSSSSGVPVGANKRVRFVGWSAAAFVMGPYTLQHPGDVASLFLLAPMFPPNGRWSEQPPTPFGRPPEAATLPVSTPAALFGFPMHVTSKTWVQEALTGTPALWEAGIADQRGKPVWTTTPSAASGGPGEPRETRRRPAVPEHLLVGLEQPDRAAGTNKSVLGDGVPVLIVYGELDRTANSRTPMPDVLHFSVPDLYKAIQGREADVLLRGFEPLPASGRPPPRPSTTSRNTGSRTARWRATAAAATSGNWTAI